MKDTMAKEGKAILNNPAKSKKRDGTPIKYGCLFDGRFEIEITVYFERADDKGITLKRPLTFPTLQ